MMGIKHLVAVNTLAPSRPSATADTPRAEALPFLDPYLAGFLLGLVLLATYLVTGRGLGATAGFAAVATGLAGLAGPQHLQASVVHLKYWNDGAPWLNWTLFLLVGALAGAALSGLQARRFQLTIERGPRISDRRRLVLAFAGGFLAACGAKLAKGCTSGQALTGSAVLSLGSLVFLVTCFAGAFALAYRVRKEWL